MSDLLIIGGDLDDEPISGGVVDPPQSAGTLDRQGPPGPPGKDGRDGRDGGNTTYTFTFQAAAAVWSIAHNLGRFPSVTVIDTAGDQVIADITYLDANTLQVAFGLPSAGVAYLN